MQYRRPKLKHSFYKHEQSRPQNMRAGRRIKWIEAETNERVDKRTNQGRMETMEEANKERNNEFWRDEEEGGRINRRRRRRRRKRRRKKTRKNKKKNKKIRINTHIIIRKVHACLTEWMTCANVYAVEYLKDCLRTNWQCQSKIRQINDQFDSVNPPTWQPATHIPKFLRCSAAPQGEPENAVMLQAFADSKHYKNFARDVLQVSTLDYTAACSDTTVFPGSPPPVPFMQKNAHIKVPHLTPVTSV